MKVLSAISILLVIIPVFSAHEVLISRHTDPQSDENDKKEIKAVSANAIKGAQSAAGPAQGVKDSVIEKVGEILSAHPHESNHAEDIAFSKAAVKEEEKFLKIAGEKLEQAGSDIKDVKKKMDSGELSPIQAAESLGKDVAKVKGAQSLVVAAETLQKEVKAEVPKESVALSA